MQNDIKNIINDIFNRYYRLLIKQKDAAVRVVVNIFKV